MNKGQRWLATTMVGMGFIIELVGLAAGETKAFATRLNAAYLGRYYLPSVSVEAMYDATINARVKGRWIQVVPAGAP